MILLKEVKLNNFLSHENTEISFKDNEKLIIDGRSGSGKSSITEAILWALYGKGRSENRSLIRRGAKTATVSVRFIHDGLAETIITRTTSTTGKNNLDITRNTGPNGQFLPIERTGLKDKQNWIESEFLKASFELFTNSVAYPQENENSFVKATASRRKDLLLEIIGASSFDELYDKTRKLIQSNETDSAVILSKISFLTDDKINSEALAEKYPVFKEEEDKLSNEIDNKVNIEKGLEKELDGITNINKEISYKNASKKNILTFIKNIGDQIVSDEKTIEDIKSLDIVTAREQVTKIDGVKNEISIIEKKLEDNSQAQMKINAHLANKPIVNDYSKDIDNLNNRLNPLIKESRSCPSGDNCPFVLPIKGQIDFLKEQIVEKNLKSEQEKNAFDKWSKDYASLVPVEDTTKLYSELKILKERLLDLSKYESIITKYETLQQTVEQAQTRRVQLESDKNEQNKQLTAVEMEIKALETELNRFDTNRINTDLSNIRLVIQKLRKSKEEAATNVTLSLKAKEHIKTISDELIIAQDLLSKGQGDTESLELLKEALSPRGIKAVVIDYLVPQLEEKINNVLGQMSDFKIRLDTQTAKADEEGIKEGLFITVINDLNEELAFTNYSGGEKVKITIAISEALASLMNQIGFRIMDENIVSLDKESTEGFVVVLEQLQSKFPQLFIISHLQEVKDMFEKRVEIIKVNGISKIL